jgi:putative nucleotidyltransferase with HDIG domain
MARLADTPFVSIMTPDATSARAVPSADDLFGAVQTLFSRPHFSPPQIPRVVLTVHTLSRQVGSGEEIVFLLGRHPPLTQGILRAVEARRVAGWKGGALRDVLVAFGPRGLANLALEVATASLFCGVMDYAAELEACREHSVWVAHTASLLAGETRFDTEPAFMAGLLHDVGTAIGLQVLGDRRLFDRRFAYETVEASLLAAHERIGALVADAWDLPPEVCAAVGHHHGRAPSRFAATIGAVDRVYSEKLRY